MPRKGRCGGRCRRCNSKRSVAVLNGGGSKITSMSHLRVAVEDIHFCLDAEWMLSCVCTCSSSFAGKCY